MGNRLFRIPSLGRPIFFAATMNGSVAPCTSSPFPSHKRNGQKVDRSTSRRVVVAVASARATTREENEAVRGQQACSCLCDRGRGWAVGKICASICFFSCLDTYLQMESEILHICICMYSLGTGTFSNPNGEIVKLLFIGPPRPRFIPLVLSCRRSAVQGKERGIHLPAGHVDRGSCFSPGRGSLSSFIRVIN